MAFDQPTRNRLQRFVAATRELLTAEFTRQLQHDYGMDPASGEITPLDRLTHLDDARVETARVLRDTADHYVATSPSGGAREALDRIVREQAFTVLNRLCAMRLAEARGVLIESVGAGYRSQGFQLYAALAGGALGETGEAYRAYLFSVFDEIAVDLAVLFDRFSPQGRLFPREAALLEVLGLLNAPDLEPLWTEDETIGWVYQYFNTAEERRQMRAESQAPRNSRELAVRNQFFTPRYVVEFLTDNTLGRIWYEMCQGQTRLATQCRYLVRRPDEVFLGHLTAAGEGGGAAPAVAAAARVEGPAAMAALLLNGTVETFPEFRLGCEDDAQRLIDLAHTVDGYARHPLGEDTTEQWWKSVREALATADADGVARSAERPRQQSDERDPGEGETSPGGVRGGAPLCDIRTQELLDFLSIAAHRDRQGGGAAQDGDGKVCSTFIRNCVAVKVANEIRRRALRSREENLSQEEMLKSPVFIPCRPMKDPRELRMLDPACGSMHFGLYAFDLYDVIYDEFWVREAPAIAVANGAAPGAEQSRPQEDEGSGETSRPGGGAGATPLLPLRSAFPTLDSLRRDVPRLIIEHNIHGIDIDPRAVQIAGLSLWLRAQRSWKALGLKPTERPRITKGNIVCAEPMPGEPDLLEDFVERLSRTNEGRVVGQLVRVIWEKMQLAGEAGSLLKIEDELTEAIAEARQAWDSLRERRRDVLPGLEDQFGPRQGEFRFDVTGIRRHAFWDEAEARVLNALREFAESATGGHAYQRRLFAADAARGFAFIDLCRKRYDVALMNPPFGEAVRSVGQQVISPAAGSMREVATLFLTRSIGLMALILFT